MVETIIVITAVVILLPFFLGFFRAEGLVAIYILGLPLLFFVVEKLHIPWSIVMTGACYPILFLPCMLLWWSARKADPFDPPFPRRFRYSVFIILTLFCLWQAKHWFERSYLGVGIWYEQNKWAYTIARWGMPFIIGVAFPLTIRRLRPWGEMGRTLAVCAVPVVVSAPVLLLPVPSGLRLVGGMILFGVAYVVVAWKAGLLNAAHVDVLAWVFGKRFRSPAPLAQASAGGPAEGGSPTAAGGLQE